MIGSDGGGTPAGVLYSVVRTFKHLGIDPFARLSETLLGLFPLGEKPSCAVAGLAAGSPSVEPGAGQPIPAVTG